MLISGIFCYNKLIKEFTPITNFARKNTGSALAFGSGLFALCAAKIDNGKISEGVLDFVAKFSILKFRQNRQRSKTN